MNSRNQSPTPFQPLPPHIRAKIGPVPVPGNGLHPWFFKAARELHHYYDPEAIHRILRDLTEDCGRVVPDREIRDAVKNSAPSKLPLRFGYSKVEGGSHKKTEWSEADPSLIRSVIESTPYARERLIRASCHTDFGNDPGHYVPRVITQLFPGDPLLCVGEENYSMRCRPRSDWGAQLASMQFIVPSPMVAATGLNQSGKVSTRCLHNTGPRRHLVIEFDDASPDEQAAFHVHLSRRFILVAVVHSGGKSLHGWYHVAGRSDSEIEGFMRCAVSLGADPHTFVRCQPVRMPGGLRRDGLRSVRQEVLFLNPEPPKA